MKDIFGRELKVGDKIVFAPKSANCCGGYTDLLPGVISSINQNGKGKSGTINDHDYLVSNECCLTPFEKETLRGNDYNYRESYCRVLKYDWTLEDLKNCICDTIVWGVAHAMESTDSIEDDN